MITEWEASIHSAKAVLQASTEFCWSGAYESVNNDTGKAQARFLEAHVNKSSVNRIGIKIYLHLVDKLEYGNLRTDTQPHEPYPSAFVVHSTQVAGAEISKKELIEPQN